jgi:anti-sigma B factor antagonist
MNPCTVHMTGSIPVIELPPRVDSDTSVDLENALKELVASDHNAIICDFSHTGYISSAGLRVLLGIERILKKRDGRLAVCSLPQFVQEVFDISGFSRIFLIYESEAAALLGIRSIVPGVDPA